MMILVREEDYDYIDPIGIFTSLERAVEYFIEKRLTPQNYVWEDWNETTFTVIETPIWCSSKDCIRDGNLHHFSKWNRYFCFKHYIHAKHEYKETERRTFEYGISLAKEEKERLEKRIKFEEKWDIKGHWYSDFIHEGSDEEVKGKIDFWDDPINWMSGTSGVHNNG